jgi:hypothetical protein
VIVRSDGHVTGTADGFTVRHGLRRYSHADLPGTPIAPLDVADAFRVFSGSWSSTGREHLTSSTNLSGRRSYEVLDSLLCTLAMLHQLGYVFGMVNVGHRIEGLVRKFDEPGFLRQELDAESRPQRQRAKTPLLNLEPLRKRVREFSVTMQP